MMLGQLPHIYKGVYFMGWACRVFTGTHRNRDGLVTRNIRLEVNLPSLLHFFGEKLSSQMSCFNADNTVQTEIEINSFMQLEMMH